MHRAAIDVAACASILGILSQERNDRSHVILVVPTLIHMTEDGTTCPSPDEKAHYLVQPEHDRRAPTKKCESGTKSRDRESTFLETLAK